MHRKWRIYYGDGSTFCDLDGDPQDAPCCDVQVIVQPHWVENRHMLSRYDYYWWDFRGERWMGGDIIGYLDYLMHPGLKIVKFGRMMAPHVFNDIYLKAKEDPDFMADFKDKGYTRG